MPATADETAFRAAIQAEPENDTPRLAYADWLDESAPAGAVLPVPRAEFIRVQCGPDTGCTGYGNWPAEKCGCDRCLSKRRESALLAANSAEWARGPKCKKCDGGWANTATRPDLASRLTEKRCAVCEGTGDAGGLTWKFDYIRNDEGSHSSRVKHEPARVRFRRGFPHRVEVPRLVDCFASGFTEYGIGPDAPTLWLAAAVAAHPVMEAVPLDREPYLNAAGCFIYGRTVGMGAHASSVIPDALFELLEGRKWDTLHRSWQAYDTREAAIAALARAIVTFARSKT